MRAFTMSRFGLCCDHGTITSGFTGLHRLAAAQAASNRTARPRLEMPLACIFRAISGYADGNSGLQAAEPKHRLHSCIRTQARARACRRNPIEARDFLSSDPHSRCAQEFGPRRIESC